MSAATVHGLQGDEGRTAPDRQAARDVLVVDDSRVIRKVALRIVEALGFAGREAEDGLVALDRCRERMPDAVLLDWNMPVMDGLAFVQVLRKLPGGCAPKVVFCTTENETAQIMRALEAGADEYVMKPFDRDIIASKFEQVGLLAS